MFDERPHRIGMLSEILVSTGHKVTWWTTSFDHQTKSYLHNKDREVSVGHARLKMIFLHSTVSYSKNISINRLRNHRQVAGKMKLLSRDKTPPDIILCSYPTIELSRWAVEYGEANHIPVVLDIRDLWPDIFVNPFPSFLKPIISSLVKLYYRNVPRIFMKASALTAVSESYLKWGIRQRGNDTGNHQVFPLAYKASKLHLANSPTSKLPSKLSIWFIGSFGYTYDLETVIQAAHQLEYLGSDLQFIITGDGQKMDEWAHMAANARNIVFTGWVDEGEISKLGTSASVGLMAYEAGAPQGLPNKLFEYMSFGLAILSSLENETKELVAREQIGISYEARNVNSLVQAIKKLLENPSLVAEYGQNAAKSFSTSYSAQRVYGRYEQYLQEIVNSWDYSYED